MSRALDPSVRKALQNGNHGEAFKRISAVLDRSHGSTYLEIEILPKSHVLGADTYVLQDEEYIGIPKLRLVQAFLHARQILNEVLFCDGGVHDEKVMRATAVLLLMDSEHLTAANVRKRVISRVASLDEGRRKDLMTREAYFLNSLLRSRLHRHTKSPVLWNHKRWLVRQLRDHDIPASLLHELEQVICVAAERHARNYYAWTYARDVIAMEIASLTPRAASSVVDSVLPVVTSWCRLHHQDISGWSFLLYLVGLFPEKGQDVAEETLRLVEKFKWRNESVWHFLKNLALMPALQTKKNCIVEVWRKMKLGIDSEASMAAITLDRAAAWGRFS
ncbi:hypothetical protein E4U13_001325 [Claviceps humidiphila]|uniref:Protein prenyltransferase n=1 Tax=Claviceps humidiphila TaxID=1294629 RepID=A0A9P7Q7I9_9HYPO|nr:hypothetical protein E4U13_001325 [Claviceps humidiphila]